LEQATVMLLVARCKRDTTPFMPSAWPLKATELGDRPSLSQFTFIRLLITGVLGIIFLMAGSRTPIEKGEQEQ
jgi:hypothetical protein